MGPRGLQDDASRSTDRGAGSERSIDGEERRGSPDPESAPPAGDDSSSPADHIGVYEWTCPICGASNTACTTHDEPLSHGVKALTSHVRITAGSGHGDRHAVPERWTPEALADHVSTDRDGDIAGGGSR